MADMSGASEVKRSWATGLPREAGVGVDVDMRNGSEVFVIMLHADVGLGRFGGASSEEAGRLSSVGGCMPSSRYRASISNIVLESWFSRRDCRSWLVIGATCRYEKNHQFALAAYELLFQLGESFGGDISVGIGLLNLA